MHHHSRSIVSVPIVLLWLGLIAVVSPLSAGPRHAAMVVDGNSGAVLHDASGSEPRHPASLTKMMTLYLVFEAIEQGRLSYATKIKISQEAASAPPSKLDLDPGEEIAVIDAIKALITKSANDIAVALAEHLAGSESRFAELMNQRARQIGMTRSHFRNASGLPDDAQITTARDMLTLALRLQDEFPRHYPLFQTRHFSYQGNRYKNHNSLLFSTQGTDGIKTGYTRMSGFNLVASVRRDGRHVIGAVFGGGTAGSRDAHIRSLLGRAIARASTEKTRRSAPIVVARASPVPKPVPVTRPRPTPPPSATIEVVSPPAARPTGERVAAPPLLTPPQPVEVGRGQLALRSTSTDAFVPPPARRSERMIVPPLVHAPAPQSTEVAAAVPPSAPGVGAQPSSLQAQAARLALGGPGTHPVAAAKPATVAPSQLLQIQVGAYASSGEAERQLQQVRGKAGGLLGRHRPLVAPVTKDSRQLYRARFTDFTPQSAAAACLELRRLAVDCFVMRAE